MSYVGTGGIWDDYIAPLIGVSSGQAIIPKHSDLPRLGKAITIAQIKALDTDARVVTEVNTYAAAAFHVCVDMMAKYPVAYEQWATAARSYKGCYISSPLMYPTKSVAIGCLETANSRAKTAKNATPALKDKAEVVESGGVKIDVPIAPDAPPDMTQGWSSNQKLMAAGVGVGALWFFMKGKNKGKGKGSGKKRGKGRKKSRSRSRKRRR